MRAGPTMRLGRARAGGTRVGLTRPAHAFETGDCAVGDVPEPGRRIERRRVEQVQADPGPGVAPGCSTAHASRSGLALARDAVEQVADLGLAVAAVPAERADRGEL